MEDETDRMSNLCTDLVSLRRFEPALAHLFREQLPGMWIPVRDLYERIAPSREIVSDQLTVTWLPSPNRDPNYSVVLFFDHATKWSMTAD